MDGNLGNQEPDGIVPKGDGHRGHGTGNRVPVRPIGRPRACAHWDGSRWVLDADAALRFKEKYRKSKDQQNERRKITRHLLKEMEKPKDTQTTLDTWA